MEEDANLVTREQYTEMLIDASLRDASEMESGFTSWCERHVPTWRKQEFDETWIRQRIETAQITRGFHRTLKQQGLTMLEIREELRKTYADVLELYDLARERERHHPVRIPVSHRNEMSTQRPKSPSKTPNYSTLTPKKVRDSILTPKKSKCLLYTLIRLFHGCSFDSSVTEASKDRLI